MKVTLARATTALYGVAIALVLFGLWVRLAPALAPREDNVQAPLPAIDQRVAAAVAVPSEEVWAPVVADNIFSVTRRPPGRVSSTPQPSSEAAALRRTPTLTLYGTTVGPEGASAIIHGDAVSPGTEIHHLGDVVAGARLVDITDSTVTLARPSGALVLHLQVVERHKL